ncbi:hypothetical protein GGI25_005675 [Coemansia spiralis]|uniref:Uncharacterized protein n=2 Tax=Coemansia TaxID=4863 RepID=A0A9W8KUG2_9FUNG|nr:hypothetical protein GGI25_005675 [Coemansia spiralis]
MQNLQFKKCEYDDWECKCHSQKKVLTCYDNCPDSENRTLQEMQVQIYCAAVNGKEYNRELIDRMTRPAKIVADEDQQAPTHAPVNNAGSQKPAAPAPPPPQPQTHTPASKGLNDEPLIKEKRHGNNYSLVDSNAAAARTSYFLNGLGGQSIMSNSISFAVLILVATF